eukprot:15459115-Alexandrium_andersonii.AAC.1
MPAPGPTVHGAIPRPQAEGRRGATNRWLTPLRETLHQDPPCAGRGRCPPAVTPPKHHRFLLAALPKPQFTGPRGARFQKAGFRRQSVDTRTTLQLRKGTAALYNTHHVCGNGGRFCAPLATLLKGR